MRRLVLLCLVVFAATSAYNLVIQEINLTGARIRDNTITCKNINTLHVDGKEHNYDCYDIPSTEDETKIQARNIVYTDISIVTKKTKLPCEVVLSDGSKFTFDVTPKTDKVGKQQSNSVTSKYEPLPVDCSKDENKDKPDCKTDCSKAENKGKDECKIDCNAEENKTKDECITTTTNIPTTSQKVAIVAKAAKKTIIRKPVVPVDAAISADPDTATNEATAILPLGLRHRGPGPVRPPVRRPPVEDTVIDEDEEETRRIKRDAADPPPAVDDQTITVLVTFYILDEAGNSAAVWAAVIEGIILIVLVGACFYFFCWAPRSRAVGAASADPYKEGPNYTVSYANSSFNNQRIDAFQNSPATPAAPARPANSSYMDDYITDNIAARPAASAIPAASAANPVASDFRPGHQRFDSSGLVTVNLS